MIAKAYTIDVVYYVPFHSVCEEKRIPYHVFFLFLFHIMRFFSFLVPYHAFFLVFCSIPCVFSRFCSISCVFSRSLFHIMRFSSFFVPYHAFFLVFVPYHDFPSFFVPYHAFFLIFLFHIMRFCLFMVKLAQQTKHPTPHTYITLVKILKFDLYAGPTMSTSQRPPASLPFRSKRPRYSSYFTLEYYNVRSTWTTQV